MRPPAGVPGRSPPTTPNLRPRNPSPKSRRPVAARPAAADARSSDPRWPTRRIFGAAFTAGTAVVLAYVLLSAIGSVAGELLLIVLALVFALGLDPVVSWLTRHGMRVAARRGRGHRRVPAAPRRGLRGDHPADRDPGGGARPGRAGPHPATAGPQQPARPAERALPPPRRLGPSSPAARAGFSSAAS